MELHYVLLDLATEVEPRKYSYMHENTPPGGGRAGQQPASLERVWLQVPYLIHLGSSKSVSNDIFYLYDVFTEGIQRERRCVPEVVSLKNFHYPVLACASCRS